MKLRCPYCKTEFEPQDSQRCPSCGKYMKIPTPYRKTKPVKKKNARDAADRAARAEPPVSLVSSPKILFTGMIVLAVLGGLLLLRTEPPDRGAQHINKRAMAALELHMHAKGLARFKFDCGRFPTTEEGLRVLNTNPGFTNWHGPYTIKPFTDPWDSRYQYSFEDERPLLMSFGADGKPETTNDMYHPWFRPPDLPDRLPMVLSDWKRRHGMADTNQEVDISTIPNVNE